MIYSNDDYIAGVQRGDEAIFTALVRTYLDPLARFAFGMTGAEDLAHDIVQDVLISVWRLGEAWDPKGSVAAYLFTAVRNRALDAAKTRRTRERLHEQLRHQIESTPKSADIYPDIALLALVRQELQSLTTRQRDALRLRYEQSMTMTEVAAILGIDLRSAKKLVARSLETLHTRLARLQRDFE